MPCYSFSLPFELSCLISFILLQKCWCGSNGQYLREAIHLLMPVDKTMFIWLHVGHCFTPHVIDWCQL
uniref:Uncharacterized protein n=1 Tax=Lotus japonicus TaxID=34305 RepID=I3S7C3_LOTJA|nr:unknown [Lotus japonicus]